jgi:hypothetical protein
MNWQAMRFRVSLGCAAMGAQVPGDLVPTSQIIVHRRTSQENALDNENVAALEAYENTAAHCRFPCRILPHGAIANPG